MEITPDQLAQFSIVMKNYFELTDYLGLSRSDSLKVGAGSWLVDYIKQMQTTIGIIKTMQMTKNAVQSVDNQAPTQELPPLPHFGLPSEK